ncbi:YrhK family protein [Corynebacterium phoceense]
MSSEPTSHPDDDHGVDISTPAHESAQQDEDPDVKVTLGRHNEFVIRNRFETASIAVDIAISVVFIVGSILFLFSLTKVGTVFFLLGSLAMAARPAIRLRRRMYLQRIGADREDADQEGSYY